jgi:hypothetical protein
VPPSSAGLLRLAPLLVAGLVLAGCSGSPAPTDGLDLTVAPSAMTILGLVQDEQFAPVAGANVSLRLFNRTTTTDALGSFRFGDLPISAYLVDVNATGFEPAVLTAEPSVGQNVSLDFVLARDASLIPRQEITHIQGIIQCAAEYGIYSGTCDGMVMGVVGQPSTFEDTSVFEVGLGRRWKTIVVDVDFDGDSHPSVEGMRLTVRGVNDADQLNEYQQYGRFYGEAPFTARLDVNGTYEDGVAPVPENLTLAELVAYPQGYGYHALCTPPAPDTGSPCPNGAGFTTDLRFDLYVTVFYNVPAPEGYTLLV